MERVLTFSSWYKPLIRVIQQTINFRKSDLSLYAKVLIQKNNLRNCLDYQQIILSKDSRCTYISNLLCVTRISQPNLAFLQSFGNVALGVMVWIIPLSIASSIVGTCLAVCFTGGRISHVAAKKGHFSPLLAMIHVKHFTPVPSVILNVRKK